MITLEQEATTFKKVNNAEIFAKDSEESFSATLQKAINLSTNTNENGRIDSDIDDKQFYYSSGSNNFLIEKDLKAETLKNMPINHVPFTPEWFLGIVSIRGVIMPVININEFIKSQTNSATTETDNCTKIQEEKSHEENNLQESYLLKLEHNAHSPIVIKIDRLPRQLDMSTNIKKSSIDKNKPDWMLNTIQTMQSDTSSIIEIDHQRLLNQIKALG
ncbi:chemotaxis protein CheW [uncultured Cocleimonas sp.]|uniref:chemotaxis protein CheW n=1 Tax=uncultured Cocleimonas sp. TaxID=1051587 RepID=UPI00261CFBB7|nr:chemotaxis protein CheW [uncultured Cocleimonas sp.]